MYSCGAHAFPLYIAFQLNDHLLPLCCASIKLKNKSLIFYIFFVTGASKQKKLLVL